MADEAEFDPLKGLFDDKPAPEAPDGDADAGSRTPQAKAEEPPKNPADDAGDEQPTGQTKMVPLAALEEARARAKAAEERLVASPASAKTTEDKPGDAPVQVRDPTEDPAGAFDDLAGVMRLEVVNTTLNLSEDMAREKHGDELVDKVRDWALEKFDNDPAFTQRILTHRNPYKAAIEEYNSAQRQEKASKLPEDVLEGLDEEELAAVRAIRAKKAEASGNGEGSGGAETPKAQPRGDNGQFSAAPPPRKQSTPPPRSLATTTAATGKTRDTVRPVGEGAAFQDVFK